MARRRPASGPPWQVILEEIRSQNRATIEAVEAVRVTLEQRIDRADRESRERDAMLEAAIRAIREDARSWIDRLDRETRERDTSLESAVRDVRVGVQQNTVDIAELKVRVQENTVEVRDLARKVEALVRLEERVGALEKRTA